METKTKNLKNNNKHKNKLQTKRKQTNKQTKTKQSKAKQTNKHKTHQSIKQANKHLDDSKYHDFVLYDEFQCLVLIYIYIFI